MFFTETNIFPTAGHSHYRIPSIVVTKHGTVLAFCNDRRNTVSDHADESALSMCRREAGGEWSRVIDLADIPGWTNTIGSAVYDAQTDTVIVFAARNAVSLNEFGDYTDEERTAYARAAQARAAQAGLTLGTYLLVSTDDGKTWTEQPFVCKPLDIPREKGSERICPCPTLGAAPGIQLRRGPHAGRLLCPARYMTGFYTTFEELQRYGFNNALYSDDHGKTWTHSAPVQAGTGEGTLIECGDGTILYNSRATFFDQKRYLATSYDGGETYGEFRTDDFLIEERNIGCNASFLRVERAELADASFLPEGADAVTLFANPRAATRCNMTVCVSFDDGKTWVHTRLVRAGGAAYSSLAYSRADGHFYLLYELGDTDPYQYGLNVAEFDHEWLMNL